MGYPPLIQYSESFVIRTVPPQLYHPLVPRCEHFMATAIFKGTGTSIPGIDLFHF